MKPIEQTPDAIRYLLINDAAVSAIVSDRVRPDVAGITDAPPYIIMNTQGTPVQTKDGTNTTAQVLLTLEMYHTTKDGLRALCAAVRTALDGQSGSFDAVDCQLITFDDEQSGFDDSSGNEGLYTHLHDYMVWVNTSNVAQLAPQFIVNPIIYANPAITVLSCFKGIYTGGGIIVSYQWKRNGSNISGATAVDYTLTVSDIGENLTCDVTLTGSITVTQVSNSLLVTTGEITIENSNATYSVVASTSPFILPDTDYNINVNGVFYASTSLPTLAP